MPRPRPRDTHPWQGLDILVSPATADEVLHLCTEVLTLALHVYRQTQANAARAEALRHLLNAEREVQRAQWWQQQAGPDASDAP